MTIAIVFLYGMNGYRQAVLLLLPVLNILAFCEKANGPLTTENVFEYFSTSMFYDKQSNNQVLRMQTIFTGVPIKDEAAELRLVYGSPCIGLTIDSFQAVHWYRVRSCSRATSNFFCHTKA